MSDTIPIPGTVITTTGPITGPDGVVTEGVITITEVITGENGLVMQVWANGMTIISDTHGYTETHTIHAVAYDSAGNTTESAKVHAQVIHRPKPEKDKKTSSAAPTAPVAWRAEDRLSGLCMRRVRYAYLEDYS
jgi:hypothetical protein